MGARRVLVSAVTLSVLLAGTPPAAAGAAARARCHGLFRRAPGRRVLIRDATAPAVGFLDGDRRADVVVSTQRGMRILTGRRDGRLRVGPRVPLSNAPGGLAVGDLDGDGLGDVAVIDGPYLTIDFGDGRGGIRLQGTSPIDLVQVAGIALADFNRDGHQDVALVGDDLHGGSFLETLLGAGGGSPTMAPGSPMPTAGDSLAVSDLNGDGNPDLVMGEIFGDAVDVELGRGDGSFAPGPDAGPPGGSETSHAIGDFNEDGRQDLAQANNRFLRVRVGNGQGGFGPTTARLRWPSIWWQAAADFDHDGHMDLAAATRSDVVRVAWGDGTGALSRTPRTRLVVAGEVDHLLGADFNGDGRSDLAVVSTRPRASVSRLTVFLGCRRR